MPTPIDLHCALSVLSSPEGVTPPNEDNASVVLAIAATLGWLVAAALTLL